VEYKDFFEKQPDKRDMAYPSLPAKGSFTGM